LPYTSAVCDAGINGGKNATTAYKAWIAAHPFAGGFRVLITWPHGFERTLLWLSMTTPV
jgi:hypothetical protein